MAPVRTRQEGLAMKAGALIGGDDHVESFLLPDDATVGADAWERVCSELSINLCDLLIVMNNYEDSTNGA